MPSKTVIQPTKTDACVGPDDSQFVSTAVQCCHPCLNCGWTKEDSREKLQPVAQTIQNKPTVTAPNPIITELDDSFEEEEISYDEK